MFNEICSFSWNKKKCLASFASFTASSVIPLRPTSLEVVRTMSFVLIGVEKQKLRGSSRFLYRVVLFNDRRSLSLTTLCA